MNLTSCFIQRTVAKQPDGSFSSESIQRFKISRGDENFFPVVVNFERITKPFVSKTQIFSNIIKVFAPEQARNMADIGPVKGNIPEPVPLFRKEGTLYFTANTVVNDLQLRFFLLSQFV